MLNTTVSLWKMCCQLTPGLQDIYLTQIYTLDIFEMVGALVVLSSRISFRSSQTVGVLKKNNSDRNQRFIKNTR